MIRQEPNLTSTGCFYQAENVIILAQADSDSEALSPSKSSPANWVRLESRFKFDSDSKLDRVPVTVCDASGRATVEQEFMIQRFPLWTHSWFASRQRRTHDSKPENHRPVTVAPAPRPPRTTGPVGWLRSTSRLRLQAAQPLWLVATAARRRPTSTRTDCQWHRATEPEPRRRSLRADTTIYQQNILCE